MDWRILALIIFCSYTGANCESEVNECNTPAGNPCLNGGICQDHLNYFNCSCPAGYSGATCQINRYDCHGVNCNKGTCIDGLDSFTCNCYRGYTGQRCDTPINECYSNPCLYGGSCLDLDNKYECNCPLGTWGPNCENNEDDCMSNPCSSSATCIDGVNNYTCVCKPGFTGNHCQIDIDDCEPNPCQNEGRCVDLENDFRCDCLPGFHGRACQSEVDECAGSPCLNGGSCVDRNNRFDCECPRGFTGPRCETDINECNSNPCQHGGICQSHLNNYTCSCVPGYTGTNCEENIQECDSSPCLLGKCFDLINNYTCQCDPLFTGRSCDMKKDNPCSPNPCWNNAKCVLSNHYPKTYRCNCLPGYSGTLCEKDINECTSTYHPCKNGGTCINLNGYYQCDCVDGYTGRKCETNHDDCHNNPCLNGGTCKDGLANYTCDCVPGFSGQRCEIDIDECESSPCVNGASCHDYLSFYTCTCPSGFSGINCHVNDNDCTNSSCLHNGTCVDKVNGYECQCISGYTGSNCQFSPKSCDSSPCLNGAICFNQDGGYQCSCPYGFTGTRCETLMDWCSQKPCQNGAACEQVANRFLCKCNSGWTGKLCDIPMVSCEVAAKQKGLSLSELCKHGGICQNIGNWHECTCHNGYDGSYCEVYVDECSSSPCLNGGSCQDLVGKYICQCAQGFQGQNCEFNIDSCATKPCQNGGTCHDLDDIFECSCPPGTALPLCEDNKDDCLFNVCHNGGICVVQVGGFRCICPLGFVGHQCEGNINECLSNPCDADGSQDCVQVSNTFRCVCKDGWTGQSCNIQQQCDHSPCQNGGECRDRDNGVVCTCKQGFIGEFCQKAASDCDPNPCRNQGACSVTASGYKCLCPTGVKGQNCETVFRDNCKGIVCQNGGTCLNRVGFFECQCPRMWRGRYCQVHDENSAGGIGMDDKSSSVPEVCQKNNCPQKGENGICDYECNLNECNYDNTDCSYGTRPWKNCTTRVNDHYCRQVFRNGKCDQGCNNQNCLFDGFDCQEPIKSCQFDNYCQANFNNGHCDHGCNNLECDWDGSDCDIDARQHVPGSLFIIVLVEPTQFREIKNDFLRQLGLLLRAVVRIKKSATSEEMVYPWAGDMVDNNTLLLRHTRQLAEPLFESRQRRSIISGTKVFLEIESRACIQPENEGCFNSADRAAEFVVAALLNRAYRTSMRIHQIGTETSRDSPANESSSSDLFIIFGVICATVLAFTLVLIVVLKRKRARGITWFPDGFFNQLSEQEKPASNRKGPEGQEMQEKSSKTDASGDGNTSCLASEEFWNEEDDDDIPQQKKTKIEGQEFVADSPGQHHWTTKHFYAANVVDHSESALTPPQGEENLHTVADINVPGPDGLTALMLAIVRGCGLGDDEECPLVSGSSEGGSPDNTTTVDTISNLLMQGASISVKTDQTGETCLHLAARYARAHAAKILLDAGADPNSEDNTGRTPLHTAVAASAEEVFQILLRNRSTNLNARMLCGTTPLMLACKLAIEDTVAELLAAEADIEATDNNGRTALHWAAAVNNCDAVTLLLKNNANRDAQNTKEETPLFLAAREGSYKAAEILLSHFANRDTTDNMDRLPRDVALERCHSDIVELLDTYIVATPAGIHLSDVTSCNHYHGKTGSVQATKTKAKNRKSKTAAGVVSPQGSIIVAPATNRQAKTRKKKWDDEKEANVQQISTSFSPNNYLQPSHPSSSATSPMSTISMGNYSVDSYSSPHHFEMSPLRFENPHHLIPPPRLDGNSLELDDFQTNSSFTPLLKHADLENLLTEWVNLQSKLQRRQEQLEYQQQQQQFYSHGEDDITNLLNGNSPNSQIGIVDNLNDTKARSVVQALPHSTAAKNFSASPTHIQANQQLGYQINAHRIPGQHISDFQTSLHAKQPPVSLINEQLSSTNRQKRLLQTQQWQQNTQQHNTTGYTLTAEQYLTPPSHDSYITDSPLHHHNTFNSLQPDHLLTLSPDSPSHWSSSSPHSAYSDWSDRISSPVSSIIGMRPQQSKFLTEHAYL